MLPWIFTKTDLKIYKYVWINFTKKFELNISESHGPLSFNKSSYRILFITTPQTVLSWTAAWYSYFTTWVLSYKKLGYHNESAVCCIFQMGVCEKWSARSTCMGWIMPCLSYSCPTWHSPHAWHSVILFYSITALQWPVLKVYSNMYLGW